jgi:hypothetical protein
VTAIPEPFARGGLPEPDHPRLLQRPHSLSEQRARWEVRAAQWRARELAELVFGVVSESALSALRPHGPLRGLLRLRVPFSDLALHREREARFMAAVESDPVLARIRLVYVIAPDVIASDAA